MAGWVSPRAEAYQLARREKDRQLVGVQSEGRGDPPRANRWVRRDFVARLFVAGALPTTSRFAFT